MEIREKMIAQEQENNNVTEILVARRDTKLNGSETQKKIETAREIAKRKFKSLVQSSDEEREQERLRKLPKPCSSVEIETMLVGFLEAEIDSFRACGGQPRYGLSDKQLFYIEWADNFCPTKEMRYLIETAKNGEPVVYDWRNSSELITYLRLEFQTAKEIQDEEDREKTISELPPWLQGRF